jgi:phosphoglucomutase
MEKVGAVIGGGKIDSPPAAPPFGPRRGTIWRFARCSSTWDRRNHPHIERTQKTMSRFIHPLAGKPVAESALIDPAKLAAQYFGDHPDPSDKSQRVAFGTSGHRGSAARRSFNEDHILAICQAICDYRVAHGIDGPLYIGRDTHALSEPAFHTALEVFSANSVNLRVDQDWGFTPTPTVSHAIVTYNKGRESGRAEGIVISPSHNPPDDGGLKYNPDHGGPADTNVTRWVETRANALLEDRLAGVKRMTFEAARNSAFVHPHDYISAYTSDLANIVDMDSIKSAKLRIGIDPLGGAPIAYWAPIIERYGLNATVFNDSYDPTFRFMTYDWDGKIRMDCSSPYAMAGLLKRVDAFDLAIATDTDADRHGIVCPSVGLMNTCQYLAAMVAYLCSHRPDWPAKGFIAKTIVTSSMIDRVAQHAGRVSRDYPVGFKWFGPLLTDGSVLWAGEESAGASFLRRDGTVWVTDKDGIAPGLLAAEMMAKTGMNPAAFFKHATRDIGPSWYDRIDNASTPEIQKRFADFPVQSLVGKTLGGEPITEAMTRAPGNNEPFGGFKVSTASGWFAARPSGTEPVYKIYAESFKSAGHLGEIQHDAQALIAS